VLAATRIHLELYRTSMEERGLAASTIDRRLSTACGFYRFAHIDGRSAAWYLTRHAGFSCGTYARVRSGQGWPCANWSLA
jgi:hypothetical protein